MRTMAGHLVCAALVLAALYRPDPLFAAGTSEKETPAPNFGAFLASFYRHYLSPVDGHECPSLPSCSAYSIKAFKKHGFFMGWMMTVDRLLHEGSEETRVSPLVLWHGKWKILDPVENNDFWWYPPRKDAP